MPTTDDLELLHAVQSWTLFWTPPWTPAARAPAAAGTPPTSPTASPPCPKAPQKPARSQMQRQSAVAKRALFFTTCMQY